MDIMALGAIGELVGGVAVIATLVYLAVQVRHATESNIASTQAGIQSEYNRFHEMVIGSPDLLATLERVANGEPLDAHQRRLFEHFAWRLVNQWIAVETAYRHGSVDEAFFAHVQQDVGNCCMVWPGLEDEIRGIHAHYSIETTLLAPYRTAT